MKLLLKAGTVINEGKTQVQDILISNGRIEKIAGNISIEKGNILEINCSAKIIIPGMIDDQVHFREPGLTHKGDLASESRAAIAGGITSFMEMPNTNPLTINAQTLADKFALAEQKSYANYSFYLGASNSNLEELLRVNPAKTCGIKIFMGSSTGDMLVDNQATLERIFKECNILITTHCEDEKTIRENLALAKEKFGEDVPIEQHPFIRSEEACYLSSSRAVELAKKYNSRLHILHLSTARETTLFSNDIPLSQKRITAEVCIHHLYFSSSDYGRFGSKIKWNPAIKTSEDRAGLLRALAEGRLDVIATDHAPHTKEEKARKYFSCPSGGPLVQHALPALFQLTTQDQLTIEQIVEKTSHNVAICFQIKERGFLREGYFADIAILEKKSQKISEENILYKCGWSPFEGETFDYRIDMTILNGKIAYQNGQVFKVDTKALEFNR